MTLANSDTRFRIILFSIIISDIISNAISICTLNINIFISLLLKYLNIKDLV